MIPQADQFTPEEISRNMRREAKAHALIDALMDCDSRDRLPFLEAIIEGLRAGMPLPFFGRVMDEARFWADLATRSERKAYCAAIFARLTPEDQDAFRTFISQKRAAA